MNRSVGKTLVACALVLAIGLVAHAGADTVRPDPAKAARGKGLAEANCAECHAIDLQGASTHRVAPPFWMMSERVPVDTIAEMLLTKATPRHSDMPHFEMSADQAEALAAWIAWVQPVAHGRRFLEQTCAGCHAIDATGESPHLGAPPLREVYRLYPIDALEEGFSEGIVTGHPDMPVIHMTPVQVSDVIAYLASLRPR
ncbi:MAG: cytochrome c [Pseudomonadota bacterium]